jgi:hypothetical protein
VSTAREKGRHAIKTESSFWTVAAIAAAIAWSFSPAGWGMKWQKLHLTFFNIG